MNDSSDECCSDVPGTKIVRIQVGPAPYQREDIHLQHRNITVVLTVTQQEAQ